MSAATTTPQEPPQKRQKKITVSPTTTATPKSMDSDTPKEPKPRPIRRLDLSQPLGTVAATQKKEVQQLVKLLKTKKKIVVVAGAGISVGAGIPDFRGSDGLFTTLKSSGGKDLFDAAVYKDSRLTAQFHSMIRNLHQKVSAAEPTAFHRLLATLAEEGRLLRLYTQNVDGLDVRLEPLKTTIPLPKGLGRKEHHQYPKTIQLHGGLQKMVCSKCHQISPLDPERFDGEVPPDCNECMELEEVRAVGGKRSLGVGKLRPRMVLYNEYNPDSDAIGDVTQADLQARPDAIIVAGTSMKIPGVRRIVREMCLAVQHYRGGLTVWVNNDAPPAGREFEDAFDLIVTGDCEKVAQLATMDLSNPSSDTETSSGPSSPPASFIELDPNEPPRGSSHVEVRIPSSQPQQCPTPPSLSPPPAVTQTKPNTKKRAAPANKDESKPAAKRQRKPTAKAAAAASDAAATKTATAPKKKSAAAPKKKAATGTTASVKNAFKATKSAISSVVGGGKGKRAAAASGKPATTALVVTPNPPSTPQGVADKMALSQLVIPMPPSVSPFAPQLSQTLNTTAGMFGTAQQQPQQQSMPPSPASTMSSLSSLSSSPRIPVAALLN